jgi:hypothetical protein
VDLGDGSSNCGGLAQIGSAEDVIWENDQLEVPIDTEGSIRFRRRRKRSNR